MIDDWKLLIGPAMLFLGMGPIFFLVIERRIHENTGRYLRFFHAICAATVLIYCTLVLIGIFLFVLGMKVLLLIT